LLARIGFGSYLYIAAVVNTMDPRLIKWFPFPRLPFRLLLFFSFVALPEQFQTLSCTCGIFKFSSEPWQEFSMFTGLLSVTFFFPCSLICQRQGSYYNPKIVYFADG
jgi:hypothetical protein